MPEIPPLKTAVLLSGNGTTLQNLIDRRAALPIDIQLVVASRADAYGLVRAKNAGIATALVESKNFRRGAGAPDWSAMGAALDAVLLPRRFDLICLAGFMCFYPLPPALRGKVINIHPALLPAFGGRGMYGRRVHEAVKNSGATTSGCTVHYVTNDYDAGPIIWQASCAVSPTDTADDIAHKVFQLECEAYPAAIKIFAEKLAGGAVLELRV
ncbi:MAG: phosphoribosylglycinamide formyltransferase [Planctomycetota bacterium]|jgi:formyltetrahydrofolate-dependent phosphoribosylglycinamide formyltransferase|nr:phosphoribosylglycinamide formyltransferase [Planctomycetota bacterium]